MYDTLHTGIFVARELAREYIWGHIFIINFINIELTLNKITWMNYNSHLRQSHEHSTSQILRQQWSPLLKSGFGPIKIGLTSGLIL